MKLPHGVEPSPWEQRKTRIINIRLDKVSTKNLVNKLISNTDMDYKEDKTE